MILNFPVKLLLLTNFIPKLIKNTWMKSGTIKVLVTQEHDRAGPARGGTKWSCALAKMPCHNFYPYRLFIVNFDGNFRRWSLRFLITIKVWLWSVIGTIMFQLEILWRPHSFSLASTLQMYGDTHDDAHLYARKSRGILMISYSLWSWINWFSVSNEAATCTCMHRLKLVWNGPMMHITKESNQLGVAW